MKLVDSIHFYFFLIFLNILIVIFFDKIKTFININDIPNNKRKIHLHPIPLLGGTLIIFNLIITFFYFFLFEERLLIDHLYYQNSIKSFIVFIFVFTSLFLTGIIDDKFTLSPIKRLFIITFLIYILCATDYLLIVDNLKFSFLNLNLEFKQLSKIFTILCFIIFIISMNMFDGINLQSFLFYLINFTTLLIMLNNFNLIIFSILLSLVFFGYLNYKNKCFLGDSGSYLLSFFLGYYLIKLYNTNEILYSDYIVNFLFLPIIDSIRVIIKRTMKKKSIFLPDNFHIHHRLLKKFGFKITIICIFFILIFPHLLVYAGLSGIIIFVLQVMVYSSAIIFSRNVSR